MDFFDINFSTLFLEKHGKQTFNNIIKQIIEESISKNNDEHYIEIVFKFAFLDFFEVKETIIINLIKDTMSVKNLNLQNIKLIHKNSIKEIQKYLQSAMDETDSHYNKNSNT